MISRRGFFGRLVGGLAAVAGVKAATASDIPLRGATPVVTVGQFQLLEDTIFCLTPTDTPLPSMAHPSHYDDWVSEDLYPINERMVTIARDRISLMRQLHDNAFLARNA